MKSMWRKKSSPSSDGECLNPNQMIKLHGEKVLNIINTVINALDDLNKCHAELNKLGYDHYKNGTRVEHFNVS